MRIGKYLCMLALIFMATNPPVPGLERGLLDPLIENMGFQGPFLLFLSGAGYDGAKKQIQEFWGSNG